MNLRRAAKDKRCLIRLPGCVEQPTVLAHYRLAGTCGVGKKPVDLAGAWACQPCHDAADGRRRLEGWTRDDIRLAHAEGVMRTLHALEAR